MRILWRAARLLGLALVLTLTALAAGVLVPAPTSPLPGADAQHAARHQVRLIRGPIHYDILLPATPELRRRFDAVTNVETGHGVPVDDPRARWIAVGWGGRAFYTTTGTYRDVSAYALWKGLTGDESVVRIDALGPIPETVPTLSLSLTRPQLDALVDSIDGQVLGGLSNPNVVPGPGFGATDRFFEGSDRFNALRPCNDWVRARLAQAGLRTGIWTPLARTLSLSLRWFGTTN